MNFVSSQSMKFASLLFPQKKRTQNIRPASGLKSVPTSHNCNWWFMAKYFGLAVVCRDLVAFDPLAAHPAPPQSRQLKFQLGLVTKHSANSNVFTYCDLGAVEMTISLGLGHCAPCHLQKTATPPGILKRRLAGGNKLKGQCGRTSRRFPY